MEKIKVLKTLEEIKAISDPYRMQIIYTIKELGKHATVKQIADKMGETPAKVHYHVKKLEKFDIITLSHTEQINGIIAKYYTLTAETITIESKQVDPAITKLIINEAQKTIDTVYDKSKKLVLSELQNSEDNYNDDDDSISSIRTANVLLSQEHAKELEDYLNKFVDKYGYKDSDIKEDDEFTKYHMFTVLFPIKNDETDNTDKDNNDRSV